MVRVVFHFHDLVCILLIFCEIGFILDHAEIIINRPWLSPLGVSPIYWPMVWSGYDHLFCPNKIRFMYKLRGSERNSVIIFEGQAQWISPFFFRFVIRCRSNTNTTIPIVPMPFVRDQAKISMDTSMLDRHYFSSWWNKSFFLSLDAE